MAADHVLEDIRGKIERERKLIHGFQALKRKTDNAEVIQRCNTQIRETQSNLDYLQETLSKLALRREDAEEASGGVGGAGGAGGAAPHPAPARYLRLDLTKYDCPSLGHRIQYMLQQLQFKLQVENQYREANCKISQLYLLDGDKLLSVAAEDGKLESDQRIQLLNKALRKYQGMNVDVDEVTRDMEVMARSARRPLLGKLNVTVTCIRDVNHFASPVAHKRPELVVLIKVDDVVMARTKPSRLGRWSEEFSLDIDKGNEIELTVYDRPAAVLVPVAVTWVLLLDITEEVRKKKVAQEMGSGWILAQAYGAAAGSGGGAPAALEAPEPGFGGIPAVPGSPDAGSPEAKPILVTSWLVLEPVGQILVSMSFEKATTTGSKHFMGALGRHGAIRQKKEEVYEQLGHQFVQKQFYNIMCCALCGEFLRYTGFQCQDCKFLCHRKCYQKVVTKCISKLSRDLDPDEAKLNHRIPHRFEPVLNRGTKWCCHCGYILPWGRKNVRKCTECGVMCHSSCTHLVPDFCGMSMEMANKILTAIKTTKPRERTEPERARPAEPAEPRKHLPPIPLDEGAALPTHTPNKQQLPVAPWQQPQRQPPPQPPQRQPPPPQPQQQPPPPPPPQPEQAPEEDEHNYTFASASEELGRLEPSVRPEPSARPEEPGAAEAPAVSPRKQSRKRRRKVGLDDFQFLAVLGKGNFGKVMLAELRHTQKLCAIKVLKKDFIVENDEAESVKCEKRVFLTANREMHPFLLNLHCCFQTENRIYFVMEYILGGDLMWHIQKARFLAKRAKFYACEVLLALKYFHDNGIVYRDLKLENILLTTQGHIKLADFGLCKENMFHGCTTGTFCGTPEFMAPEIIAGKQYERSVDWWAFGVLLFQMLLCQLPFKGDDEDEIFNAIEHDDVRYPISMPRQTVLVLQALLTKDPKQRLGSSPRDAAEIMEHQYFSDVDFNDVFHCAIPPPYLPELTSEHDYSNFDNEFTLETPRLTPVDTVLTLEMQEQFRGFSHISNDAAI